MSYVKGDRVRMRSNPTQVGTVTGERDQMFLSFVGVQWDGLDFAFLPPSNIEPDAPTIVGQSKPSPDGKVLTDWQTRAEQAEAAIGRVRSIWHADWCCLGPKGACPGYGLCGNRIDLRPGETCDSTQCSCFLSPVLRALDADQ